MAQSTDIKRRGLLGGLATLLMPYLLSPALLLFTHSMTVDTVVKLISDWRFLMIAGLQSAVVFVVVWRSYQPFVAWHRNPVAEGPQIEVLQKNLVVFPKLILVGGLITGFLDSAVLKLVFQDLVPSMGVYLLLGFSSTIFFGMPCYIIYLQRFESWNKDIPFSREHLSLPLDLRVNLVSSFVISSLVLSLIVAFGNVLSMEEVPEGDALGRIAVVGLPLALTGLLVGILNMFLLMRGISRRISRAKNFVVRLSGGDLGGEPLALSSRDELGVLALDLNLVQANMGQIIGSTRDSVCKTVRTKDDLVEICGDTAREIAGIENQIRLVETETGALLQGMDRSLLSVKHFQNSISTLNQAISRQSSMIDDTSSSITQMDSSIANIVRITNSRLESSRNLGSQVQEGEAEMKRTIGFLETIAKAVETIRSITGVIQGIAAQTNLLSMNAAIEAAHAGSAGLGFSVVADEIRKLAETAGSNSKGITRNVKEIVTMIQNALEAGTSTAGTFREVSQELQSFLDSYREIDQTMEEMRAGSTTILSASNSLKEVSQEVLHQSADMEGDLGKLNSELGGLRHVYDATQEAVRQSSLGIRSVVDVSMRLAGSSKELDGATSRLVDDMARFRMGGCRED